MLVDDGGYGMLRYDQQRAGDEPFGVDLGGPNFPALAAAFGVPSVTVNGWGDAFARALCDAVSADAPAMIVVSAHMRPPRSTSPRWYRRA